MKTLIIITAFVLISAISNAQTAPVFEIKTDNPAGNNYVFSHYTDQSEKFTLIEFAVMKDDFVKIYVTSKTGEYIQTLVEGEPGEGSNRVIFKPSNGVASGNYICSMKVYSKDKSRILYYSEKEIGTNTDNADLW